MEENRNPNPENQPAFIPEPLPEIKPEPKPQPKFLARGREFLFGGVILLLSILLCNFVFFGGTNLAFGIVAAAAIVCSWLYLKKSGHRFGGYEKALLLLSLVICGGFGRSNDAGVKLVMLLFLFGAVNLGLCVAAGQNRRNPSGALSLLDAPRAFYRLGIGNSAQALQGVSAGFRQGGQTTRRIGAVGTGLLISIPVLAVMITLLVSADAAFEGLLDLLPELELEEYLQSAFWGLILGCILYSRGVSLAKEGKPAQAVRRSRKGINAMTVNTVLVMVCLVYLVYLFSQLADLSGGLAGILPEEFTMAEYARRGFFEMAWLCTLNLGLLCFAIWLIREEQLPRMTKIAGTFIGAITIFLVITASAKMFLYIGAYGLTRLRVLTEVIMLWLALTTVLVTIRLFLPRFGYMKAVVLTAMVLGTLVLWVDVNTLVANYNMKAWKDGRLETIDVSHLGTLNAAGVPWLIELADSEDPLIAKQARDILDRQCDWNYYQIEDFRDWNYEAARAREAMEAYRAEETAQIHAHLSQSLGLQLNFGTPVIDQGHTFLPEEGVRFLRLKFTVEEAEILEALMAEEDWQELPIMPSVHKLIAGAPDNQFNRYCPIPVESGGRWFFLDRYPQTQNSDEARNGYRYTLCWYYDAQRVLYYYDVDTLPKE